MREIVDIIENIVNGLSFTTTIKTVTDNGNGTYTLGVCCTYHVQPFCNVTINAVSYRVTDIVNNESITIILTEQKTKLPKFTLSIIQILASTTQRAKLEGKTKSEEVAQIWALLWFTAEALQVNRMQKIN